MSFRWLIDDVCDIGIHFGSPETSIGIRQINFFTPSRRDVPYSLDTSQITGEGSVCPRILTLIIFSLHAALSARALIYQTVNSDQFSKA